MSTTVAEVEKVVLATPGVLALYRTGPVVANLIGAAAELLELSEDAALRVSISQGDDRTEVDIAIGIDSAEAAAEIVHTVRERVDALLLSLEQTKPFVRVTVVHVAEGESPRSLA